MVYTLTLAEPAEIKTKAFIDDRWQNSAVYHFHGVVYYKNIERKTEYKNFWPKKTELINLYYIVIMIITICTYFTSPTKLNDALREKTVKKKVNILQWIDTTSKHFKQHFFYFEN